MAYTFLYIMSKVEREREREREGWKSGVNMVKSWGGKTNEE